ncbi:MAG: NfeD family protein [Roseburia sp.]|nr:NfeD family protein [Roseburia sp.]
MTVLIWLIIMIIFLIAEAITVGLATIWFAAGALAAMAVCALGFGTFIQFVVFFIVSMALLVFTRPFALKYVNPNKIRTNYEDVVDKTVKITERVDNINGTGTAVLNGQEWTARSKKDDEILEPGNLAKVVEVTGVKLIVVPIAAD